MTPPAPTQARPGHAEHQGPPEPPREPGTRQTGGNGSGGATAVQILIGDCRQRLAELPEGHFQTCITSVPYWGQRVYIEPGAPEKPFEIGLEANPQEWCDKLVDVFRAVRRVLRDDGTLWCNVGDGYGNDTKWGGQSGNKNTTSADGGYQGQRVRRGKDCDPKRGPPAAGQPMQLPGCGVAPKNLIGLPWRLAFALQADGWYLRSDIIWAKPAPMPESVTDRPTKSHEYIFLLTKNPAYFYDAEAVKEPCSENTHARISQDLAAQVGSHRANGGGKTNGPMKAVIAGSTRKLAEAGSGTKANGSFEGACVLQPTTRNQRTVWTFPSQGYKDAHFATFPEALVTPCILAGTSEKGCCAACGRAVERAVERAAMVLDRSERTHPMGRTRTSGTMVEPPRSKTVGWDLMCECGAPVVPCRVLDPFGGSGTTAAVARKLGRHATIVELNPSYADMARRRIGLAENPQTYRDPRALDSPLFTEAP